MDSDLISGVHLRAATVDDAVAIIELHFAAVHQTAAPFYSKEVLDSWSRQPDEMRYEQVRRAIVEGNELFVVAEDAAGVIGFGSIVPMQQELRAVYVHPAAGRRGVGRRVLAYLEGLALDRGVSQLVMDASVNAEAFYQHAGYEVVERGVHRLRGGHEMACVKMRKSLAKATHPISGRAV